jgi:arginase
MFGPSVAVRRFAVVRAPSELGLRAAGVKGLGDALLGHGLAQALGARIAAIVAPPPASGVRDPASGVLNAPEVAAYAVVLADAVGAVLDAGDVPLVLGGDCSVLLGGALALRRGGGGGLLFLDGHADFYQPSAEPSGEAASMDLALATGHGPPAVGDLEGLAPLVRDQDAVVVGFRDAEEQARNGAQPLPGTLLALDLAAVRAAGVPAAAERAIAHLTRPSAPDRFWVHLDADVLDDAVMPAVDYRQPGGLSPDELATILAVAMATHRVAGIEVTIYNPALDADGTAGAALTWALTRGLGAPPPNPLSRPRSGAAADPVVAERDQASD